MVWTVLYVLMGIASYLVSVSDAPQEEKTRALWTYGIQLAFNFLWPIVFFNLKWYFFAFLWLVMLWALILITLLRLKDSLSKMVSVRLPLAGDPVDFDPDNRAAVWTDS